MMCGTRQIPVIKNQNLLREFIFKDDKVAGREQSLLDAGFFLSVNRDPEDVDWTLYNGNNEGDSNQSFNDSSSQVGTPSLPTPSFPTHESDPTSRGLPRLTSSMFHSDKLKDFVKVDCTFHHFKQVR